MCCEENPFFRTTVTDYSHKPITIGDINDIEGR